jgi:hypothetical protein
MIRVAEKTAATGRVDVGVLLKVRAATVIEGLSAGAAAKRFGVTEKTAVNAAIAELPKERCPTCRGLCVLPCLKCAIEKGS